MRRRFPSVVRRPILASRFRFPSLFDMGGCVEIPWLILLRR